MDKLAQLDHAFVWHPFTQMRDWLKREPIIITSGRGAVLHDTKGREYLDANSSIWTNLHGHQHPKINAAIARQLDKISHSSALGLASGPASVLAANLVTSANPWLGRNGRWPAPNRPRSAARRPKLNKVFYSDDGSTAIEVALKLAYEFTRRTRGQKTKPRFLSLDGAYHGDTVGAVSFGHIDLFHNAYSGLLFKTDRVMAPYCYRCPFNRAKPERGDARDYRKCNWECVGVVEKKLVAQQRRGNPYAALTFEPLMQGAAGMIPQPKGWLRRITDLARSGGTLLIADEVMTGFGRTGTGVAPASRQAGPREDALPTLFASHHEGVQPDFLCVAKGLTGGYLPMAATLTTQRVFDAFLGPYQEFKTFFHGHSFTGNQLGASAALASLDILQTTESLAARTALELDMSRELKSLWSLSHVGDIRQAGMVAGIELVKDWHTREPYELPERAGIRVCEGMARRGVLTRPVGNVIPLLPPYCTTPKQMARMVAALREAVQEVLG